MLYARLRDIYRSPRTTLIARFLRMPIIRQLRSIQTRRLKPLNGGRMVGTPVVRYYWAQFLKKNQADIKGRALEIENTNTIRHYGGSRITEAEAIDLSAHSPEVKVVADLTRADHVDSDLYDCFVNQFAMHVIYDVEAALYHSIRILKPGGTLLINFSCVDYYFNRGLDMGTGAPLFMYWWFTPIQVENMLRKLGLTEYDYKLEVYGNLFTRISFLLNLPAEDLTREELNHYDPGHPLLICARIVKPIEWKVTKPEYKDPWTPNVTPAKLSPITGHYDY
jgi:SAM-dependent methyltransferase